jgi:NADH-quinone oxidoreductase subunit C
MSDATAPPPDEAAPTPEPPTMHGCPLSDSRGQTVLHPSREQYVGVVRALLDEGYEMCSDLTATDYLMMPDRAVADGVTAERFEVVVNLLSLTARKRIRLRVQVPGDDPSISSLFDLHPGTEAMEREAFDMFGITFTDHPDLTRILMPEDWEGYPLRKDYDTGAIPVQFSTDFGART